MPLPIIGMRSCSFLSLSGQISLCRSILLLLKFPGVLSNLTKDIVDLHIAGLELEGLAVLVGDVDDGSLVEISMGLGDDLQGGVGSNGIVGDDP